MNTAGGGPGDQRQPIFDVAVTPEPAGAENVRGNIERPVADVGAATRVNVSGWVVSNPPAAAVEVVDERGSRVLRLPVDVDRPDVEAAFPDRPGAPQYGFHGTFSAGTATGPIHLRVHAMARDMTSAPIATISLSPRPGPPDAVVSIIIPCHNQAQFLGDAIESAITQTYPHLEVVVVDDGSTDNTGSVMARFPGIRLVSQRNGGPASARNAGLEASSGAYVIFLDADDRLCPAAAAIGVDVLRSRPECGAVFGWYQNVDAAGHPLPTPVLPALEGAPYEALLRTNWTGQPATAMYRRRTLDTLGGYDESMPPGEDYELNLRIVHAVPVHHHGAVVVEFRRHSESISTNRVLMLEAVLHVLDEQWPHVAGDPQLRAAWRQGRTCWRSYYGQSAAEDVATAVLERRWRSALSGLATLVRRHPQGALRFIGEVGRRWSSSVA